MSSRVHIISLDADGCLFHKAYIDGGNQDVVAANQDFVGVLQRQGNDYDKTISFVGSNRQDFTTDLQNSSGHNTGSCFPAIQAMSDAVGATLDKMLLSDIQNDRQFGHNFDSAIAKQFDDGYDYDTDNIDFSQKIDEWVFDQQKLTILYAQIHKAANDNPKSEIVFDFYDDRDDILDALGDYFKKYPHMLPDNVELNLNHYKGGEVTNKHVIHGTGSIDMDFRNTVKTMADLSTDYRAVIGDIRPPINAVDHIHPINTKKISSQVKNIEISDSDPDYMPMVALKSNIETRVSQYEKSSNLDKITGKVDRKFKNSCIDQIDITDRKLTCSSSWKPFLKNLTALFSLVGTFSAVMSFGERVFTGRYGLFNGGVKHAQQSQLKSLYQDIVGRDDSQQINEADPLSSHQI